MSKISRRNFIKGAGVAALAVAAAGMLAGCGSGAPEMVDVHVGYYYKNFVGDVKPIDDAKKYAEVVSVVKGGKVKKERFEKSSGCMQRHDELQREGCSR